MTVVADIAADAAAAGPVRVCLPFVGDLVGGSHVSALKMARALDRSRWEPLVVVHEEGALVPYLRTLGLPYTVAPRGTFAIGAGRRGLVSEARAAAASLAALPRLARFLRAEGVDIVHTNDGRIHALWGPAARLAGARVVWHHRGDPDARGVNLIAPILADRLVTVSRFSRPARPVRPVDGRLAVIHSPFERPREGVSRTAARAALVAELGCPEDTFLAGYVGFFIERKRPVAFVDVIAAARARARRPVMGLLFGNSVPGERRYEEDVLARAADLGIADSIRLMGFRPDPDTIMAGLDALVVPALSEPFGRTLIEAMMAGTPVIATNHGGNPEAIEHGRTGLLVAPDDLAGLGAAVAEVADDAALAARLRSEAMRDAFARYSVATHVAEIGKIYDAIAARDRRQVRRIG